MSPSYQEVVSETKRISKEIQGREIKDVFIDYLACWNNNQMMGYCPEYGAKDMIIFEIDVIDNGTPSLIKALITHECCHLKYKHHTEQEEKEFQKCFNQFTLGHRDIVKHPDYPKLSNKLISLGIYKDGEWTKPKEIIRPKYDKVKEILEEEGIDFNDYKTSL